MQIIPPLLKSNDIPVSMFSTRVKHARNPDCPQTLFYFDSLHIVLMDIYERTDTKRTYLGILVIIKLATHILLNVPFTNIEILHTHE